MVDRDILFSKINSVQRCLKRISEVTQGNAESLAILDVEEIVTLNLQRAIQSSIDLAAHIIADAGWSLPKELRENFDLCCLKKKSSLTSWQNSYVKWLFLNFACLLHS